MRKGNETPADEVVAALCQMKPHAEEHTASFSTASFTAFLRIPESGPGET